MDNRENLSKFLTENRMDLSENLFREGYNCTQSVVLAFLDLFDIDKSTLMKICMPFGGGMGRLREVCGAVSGMFIVLGLYYGDENSDLYEEKKKIYEKVQYLANEFEKQNTSIICRELLNLNVKKESFIPEKRTDEYYKKRTCISSIRSAVQILNDYIKNNPI